MNIPPTDLVFETREDVVNYITRGIVPRREDADLLINEIRNPGSSVIKIEYAPNEEESAIVADVLEIAYDNIREMQRVAAIACGVSGVLGFLLGKRF